MGSAYLITLDSKPQFVVNVTPKPDGAGGAVKGEKNCPDFAFMLDRLEKLAGEHYEEFYSRMSYKQYREVKYWSYVKLPAI